MKQEGLDDMTLLSKVTNEEIAANLKLRYEKDIIYVRFRYFARDIASSPNQKLHRQTSATC